MGTPIFNPLLSQFRCRCGCSVERDTGVHRGPSVNTEIETLPTSCSARHRGSGDTDSCRLLLTICPFLQEKEGSGGDCVPIWRQATQILTVCIMSFWKPLPW